VILIATLVLLVRVTVLVLEVPDWTRPKVSVCGEYLSGPRLGLLAGSSELVAVPTASGTLNMSLCVPASAGIAWAIAAAPNGRRPTTIAIAVMVLRHRAGTPEVLDGAGYRCCVSPLMIVDNICLPIKPAASSGHSDTPGAAQL
jgi:hypothetical protein